MFPILATIKINMTGKVQMNEISNAHAKSQKV